MKKFYKITTAIALLLICIISVNAQNIDVYVGGTQNDQAAIWKNEVPELLEGWEVNDIEIIGEDIYVAGLNGEGIPVIWKNNEIIYTLDEFTFVARSISSMEIYGDDVYVTTIDLTNNGFVSRLWINGVDTGDYTDATELYAVVVDGDDIYVAGGTSEGAVIWKNAEPLYTYSSNVTALFVDMKVVDGDVYYIGGDFGGAGKSTAIRNKEDINVNQDDSKDLSFNIWKNDEILYTIGNQVYGAKLFIYNGNVYACGQAPNGGPYNGIVWINGEPNVVTTVWSGAQGIYVYNDDVYVTGFMGDYPELDTFIWKNGELTTLTSPGYDMGNCILVIGENDGVEEINEIYNIYPNPADNYITIEGVEFQEAVLYNSMGQVVVASDNNKIDVSCLESGLYLLKLDNNITRKVIIKH